MSIEDNIRARKHGEQLSQKLKEYAKEYGSEFNTPVFNFWRAILKGIPQEVKENSPNLYAIPMTEDEAIKFENNIVQFGKHSGKKISDIPLEYLFWLDNEYDLRRELKRYLLSDRVQREQK